MKFPSEKVIIPIILMSHKCSTVYSVVLWVLEQTRVFVGHMGSVFRTMFALNVPTRDGQDR